MAIFRSKSSQNKRPTSAGEIDIKISSKDQAHYKMHSANVHDPILTAVNEQQPFEQAADRSNNNNRRPSYLSQDSTDLKDIFGNPISQSDMSNPTRARNERPLDTIRGFEYAITGEVGYRDQLESLRLGWGFHEDFPFYNLQNGSNGDGTGASGRPVINFSNNVEQPVYQAGNYSATSLNHDGGNKKKKKGGLFGRKKK